MYFVCWQCGGPKFSDENKLVDLLSSLSNLNVTGTIHAMTLNNTKSCPMKGSQTMKLYSRKLHGHLKKELGCDHTLNFLHCNAHFLLGLSSACEKAVRSKEGEFGGLGRDKCGKFSHFSNVSESATGRLIRMLCEIVGPRGDQKNGCIREWCVYCENSLIPSLKSNRFNCFFLAAANIVHHLQTLKLFFTSRVLRECKFVNSKCVFGCSG